MFEERARPGEPQSGAGDLFATCHAWAEAFGERSFELRADLDEAEVRIALQTSVGVAVRSWTPDADRFASATVSPTEPVGAVAERLLLDTGETRLAQQIGMAAALPAERLTEIDSEGIIRAIHDTLRGFQEGARHGGAGRCSAVIRLRLRDYRVATTEDADFTGSGLHIHVFGEAYHGQAMGASGLALSDLAELTGTAGHNLGHRTAAQAVRLSRADRPASSQCSAVFTPIAAGVLVHEVVGHSLEADAATAGSALWRRRQQRIGPDTLHIYDDGRQPDASEAVTADEEGTPLERAHLVTGGMVVGFATDRAAARRLGLPRSSGHGRRGAFAHRPTARVRHTVVTDGADAPAEVIADTRDGILIEAVQTGEANIRDGRFTIRVREGRPIRGGQLGPTMTDFTVTGTLEDFAALDALGNDGARSHALCGRGSHWMPISGVTPTLRLPRVDLHGAV
jgi:predicted Zn-dependent protease